MTVENVISEDKTVSEVFNNFYFNIVLNLNIETEISFDKGFIQSYDNLSNAIKKYSHPSITMINEIIITSLFSFSVVTYDKLEIMKTSQQTDIPTKILIQNSKYFAEY